MGGTVARRTYLELLIDTLKTQPGEQASAMKIPGLLGWEPEKVRKVASKGHDSPLVPVFIAKGGVIKHRGSERGASVGIYADVARVIATYWGRWISWPARRSRQPPVT